MTESKGAFNGRFILLLVNQAAILVAVSFTGCTFMAALLIGLAVIFVFLDAGLLLWLRRKQASLKRPLAISIMAASWLLFFAAPFLCTWLSSQGVV